ncbi:unnamed protein product, partial [Mesorhabditis belari]|uniref:Uncharacterized protein n=1 Tax=Mesorhabditis belari TaxID=2138241 RepID=A0AAF3F0P3_9BILA
MKAAFLSLFATLLTFTSEIECGMVEDVQARKELFFKPGGQLDDGLKAYAIKKNYATNDFANQLIGVFHNMSATLNDAVANTRVFEKSNHVLDGFKVRAGLGKRLADLGAAADKDFQACIAEFDLLTKDKNAVTWSDVINHKYTTCNPAILNYVSNVVVPGLLFQIVNIYDPLVPEGKTTEFEATTGAAAGAKAGGGLLNLGGILGGVTGALGGVTGTLDKTLGTGQLLSRVTGALTGTVNGITATLDHIVSMKEIIPNPPTSLAHVLNVFDIDE